MKALALLGLVAAVGGTSLAVVSDPSRASEPERPTAPGFGPNPSEVHVAGRGWVPLTRLAERP
jgi:hypothetical protein